MKTKIALVGFFLLSIVGFGQISTTRMNELKIGMRPSEVLKLLGKKPAAIVDEGETNITLKGIDYTIEIRSGYLSKTENDTYLSSISTTSKNIKTLSGIVLAVRWRIYGKLIRRNTMCFWINRIIITENLELMIKKMV